MEDPVKEIEGVINGLTTSRNFEVQTKTLNKYYTSDAGFDHPLAWVHNAPNSRETVLMVYRSYSWLSDPQKIVINSMSFDKEKLQMTIDLDEYAAFFLLPWRTVKLRLVVVLTLKKVNGKYYIYKQEDFFPTQDLLSIIPGLGLLYRAGKTVVSYNAFLIGAAVNTLKVPRIFFPSPPQQEAKKLK
eukprot:TRINITY_DN1152_c0_g1_i1.p1 TRINITY_DN1152_c0_g1~~TRINITY_DN1152_c0_g1_i1.p1  ORF type:complete len:207 (-),score=68.28 TRINITY_DN1152_c0_g1_i1:213-770(-)